MMIGGVFFDVESEGRPLYPCSFCPYGKPWHYVSKQSGFRGVYHECTDTVQDFKPCASARWQVGLKVITL